MKDNPAELFFSVAVDDAKRVGLNVDQDETHGFVSEDNMARRVYITAAVRQRLHQRAFRERVLEAYRHQCSFCRLRHEQLLDAAHIIGDTEPQGEPIVRNGLSLCKLHHAAFDAHFVGLRPDYVLEVRPDILRERDGQHSFTRFRLLTERLLPYLGNRCNDHLANSSTFVTKDFGSLPAEPLS